MTCSRNNRARHGQARQTLRRIDEHGVRQSETYDEYKDAVYKLREHEVQVEEVRRGLRRAKPLDKTFDDLADYRAENRATP